MHRNSLIAATVLLLFVSAGYAQSGKSSFTSNNASVVLRAEVPSSVAVAPAAFHASLMSVDTEVSASVPLILSWDMKPASGQSVGVYAYADVVAGPRLNTAFGDESCAPTAERASCLLHAVSMMNGTEKGSLASELKVTVVREDGKAGAYAGVLHLRVEAY